MHILRYVVPLCIFHAILHAFIVEHDVFKRVVEGDKTTDVVIGVSANVQGERSASSENSLDSIIQRTFPSVNIAFD
jgi:hypothetical protein